MKVSLYSSTVATVFVLEKSHDDLLELPRCVVRHGVPILKRAVRIILHPYLPTHSILNWVPGEIFLSFSELLLRMDPGSHHPRSHIFQPIPKPGDVEYFRMKVHVDLQKLYLSSRR